MPQEAIIRIELMLSEFKTETSVLRLGTSSFITQRMGEKRNGKSD
jgi:hypothetical protein